MSNTDAEGRVHDEEARARRLDLIAFRLNDARDELADELMEPRESIDWLALDDGRYVVRCEGYPVWVANLSSLDADARLVLDDEDYAIEALEHYSSEALRVQAQSIVDELEGDVENGPGTISEDDAKYLGDLHNELDRRDVSPEGACDECGQELDRDCWGELRCAECDGECSGCYSGHGPDVD